MFESIFTIFLIIYTIIAIKVKQWITISALGFRSETPQYFFSYPIIYILIRSIFFLFALCSIFLIQAFPWYIGLIILIIIWFSAGWIGRKRAFKDYRRILREMIDYAESDEEKYEYKKEMIKTDIELIQSMNLIKKYL